MPPILDLRKHREEVLFETLETVARRGGFSRMMLSYLERGSHPPRKSNYKKIAKGYRLPVATVAAALSTRTKK